MRLHGVARPRNCLKPTVSAPSVLGAKRHAFSISPSLRRLASPCTATESELLARVDF